MIEKKLRQKKCRHCKELFTPWTTTQVACSTPCAIEIAGVRMIKSKKSEDKKAKRALKDNDRGFQIKKAQTLFNRYIRLRDAAEPCISCQRYHDGQYHAGHYRTTKAAPQLRFNRDNCHKQCSACNTHLSGNISEYRINLIKKIGVERVEALENDNDSVKHPIDYFKGIQRVYKDECAKLELENNV